MLNLTAALLLLLSPPPPIVVGGQVKAPVPREARASLVAVVPDAETGRFDLEGKTGPEPAVTAEVDAEGAFRLQAPKAGMPAVRTPWCAS